MNILDRVALGRIEEFTQMSSVSPHDIADLRQIAEFALEALRQQPVSSEFKGSDGKWYPFDSEKHRQNTIEAGFEVRNLYGLPGAIPVIKMPQRMECEGYHIDEAYLQPADDGEAYEREDMLLAIRDAGCVPEEKGDKS